MSGYAFGKAVSLTFDDAIARVTEALAAEQFGVLSDIDVAGTLKKKLTSSRGPAPEMASADVNFARVLGMYAKPVSGSSPATSVARSASHPFVPNTNGA